MEIKKKICRSDYRSLYSRKLKNLDEIDNFLEKYHLQNLIQHQKNLNSPMTHKEIEAVIKSLPTQKPKTTFFLVFVCLFVCFSEFYQAFKEYLIPIFFKLLHKTKTGHCLFHFM